MSRVVSATDARIHFGELMRQVVERQETVIVERAGKPQLVLLSLAEYERLQSTDRGSQDWKALVRQSREQARRALAGRALPPPAEVLRQIREERDEQLLRLP